MLVISGVDLFSAGDYLGDETTEELILLDEKVGVYKKLVIYQDKIIGIVLYGDTVDASWYLKLLKEHTDISDLRTKILFGTINFNGAALDEAGNDVSGYDGQIPFILDIKNKDSINALKDVLEQIKNDSTVPIEAKLLKRSITLSSKIESVPQTYATILFTLKGATDLADEDSKTFESFQDWIKWSDGYVLDRWKENNTQELNEADAELVDAFVDVEGVGV